MQQKKIYILADFLIIVYFDIDVEIDPYLKTANFFLWCEKIDIGWSRP